MADDKPTRRERWAALPPAAKVITAVLLLAVGVGIFGNYPLTVGIPP